MNSSNTSRWIGLMYVSPALIFVCAFVLYPFGQLINTSLTSRSLLGGGAFVGLANYQRALSDSAFWSALGFTVRYTLYITPILMGLGLLLAFLVLPNRKIRKLVRGIIFLPVVIGLGTSSFLWYWLFDERVGLFNKILVDLGVMAHPMVWFNTANVALWAVIISVTWKVVGFGMILFVASMQSISSEVVEASLIDGTNYWQRATRIFLPLILRTILLVTLISAIGSMLAFEQLYIMTAGGPRGETLTSVYLLYQNSFINFKLGYGAALSVILTAIILCGAALQLVLTNRKAHQ
ncbi:MAG: sugar ABC transporter permease [Aestuariivirga sp.]